APGFRCLQRPRFSLGTLPLWLRFREGWWCRSGSTRSRALPRAPRIRLASLSRVRQTEASVLGPRGQKSRLLKRLQLQGFFARLLLLFWLTPQCRAPTARHLFIAGA